MDERKTPVVTSKYTWANAPLEWHSVYCILLWFGAVRLLFDTIVEIMRLEYLRKETTKNRH